MTRRIPWLLALVCAAGLVLPAGRGRAQEDFSWGTDLAAARAQAAAAGKPLLVVFR